MDPSQEQGLQEQISELQLRMQRLEAALNRYTGAGERPDLHAGAAPEASMPVPPPPPLMPQMVAGSASPVSRVPAFRPRPLRAPSLKAVDQSLESRIGSQWFNRIGILAVLIGMSWFLKLAIDNHWIGPLGRVLIGLIAGVAIVVWSERFQKKGYAAFGYSLKAVGSGILYLSLWAAFALFHLIPSTAAFAAMILVTAFNGFLA